MNRHNALFSMLELKERDQNKGMLANLSIQFRRTICLSFIVFHLFARTLNQAVKCLCNITPLRHNRGLSRLYKKNLSGNVCRIKCLYPLTLDQPPSGIYYAVYYFRVLVHLMKQLVGETCNVF